MVALVKFTLQINGSLLHALLKVSVNSLFICYLFDETVLWCVEHCALLIQVLMHVDGFIVRAQHQKFNVDNHVILGFLVCDSRLLA